MNTKKIIEIQNKIFFDLKNIWKTCEEWEKSNLILDTFLDELEIKKSKETRFIAYSRISELRVEPLELYLDEMQEKIEENNKKLWLKLPNKLENKQIILNKAYNYVKRIYEDLFEKFIYELEKENCSSPLWNGIIGDLGFEILKWTLEVWKAFNNFMPVWQKAILKQNDILDKKFKNNSEKIMSYLKEKELLDTDEKWNICDRCYSVLIAGKSRSYFDAFPTPGSVMNFQFLTGSCQQAGGDPNSNSGLIFPIMAQENPAFFIHQGDWGYPDTTDDEQGQPGNYFPLEYSKIKGFKKYTATLKALTPPKIKYQA